MTEKIEEKLKDIFLKVFQNMDKNDFNLDKDKSKFEGWDSLAHMQLISEIESAFGISLQMDEVVDINKPKDFFDLIEKKYKENNK